MANVGTAPAGRTLIGAGNTSSPTFAQIGTNSGLTNHGILIAQGNGAFVASPVGTAGQIFQSSGAGVDPAYSTATYPSTTTINQILYSSANNVVSAITAGNFGVLISNGTGVPSWLPNGTTGQVLGATTGGSPSWVAAATGTVTSVTGTANRITVTPSSPNPVVDIAATYVGQTSITTLGTITTGVWNGSVIPLAFGGTNANLTASNGGIFYSTATAGAILAGTATASQVLLSGASAAPAWSVATFPSAVGAAGTQLRSNGTTGWVASTIVWGNALTANNILYASSTNTQGQITSANNGTLVTSNTGVPSILAGPGTTGNILQSNAAAAPSWSTATYPSTTTVNQLLYSSATNVVSGLTNGTTGQVLTATTGSAPSWQSPAAGTGVNKVITQTFSTAGSGTYTPSTGMLYCIVELVGAGGGGGGTAATTAAQLAVAGGGGSGAFARTTFSAADIGASKPYTVGQGGAGGTAGANNGTGGTNSTFGTGATLVQGGGGGGGIGGAASGTISFNLGGAAGVGVVPAGGTGAFAVGGAAGEFAASNFGVSQWNGRGAQSYFGQTQQYRTTTGAGFAGGSGSGGSGAYSFVSAAAQAGGNGGDGLIIITEFTT